MADRKGKHNVGHRDGCPKDLPEGWHASCCACDWLDRIDTAKADGGFHWRNDIYFKRLAEGVVRMRIFGRYNGTSNYTDSLIPPSEWASIMASVSAAGENGDTFHAALFFHNIDLAAAAKQAEVARRSVLESARVSPEDMRKPVTI